MLRRQRIGRNGLAGQIGLGSRQIGSIGKYGVGSLVVGGRLRIVPGRDGMVTVGSGRRDMLRIRLQTESRQRIGPSLLGGATLGGTAFGCLVDREEVHRIGPHEERVALRTVVTYGRGTVGEQRIARLLPILAVLAEGQHLVLRIVELDVAAQDDVVAHAVEIDAVAPHLLLVGEQVAVARHDIERIGLLIGPAVGVEVVAVAVPDIGPVVEESVVGGHVVDHRVARKFVLVVTHLDPLDRNQLLRVGIVVAAHRFEQVVAVGQHAPAAELTDVLLRVEEEFVGIERRVAVDHLHDVGIDPCLVPVAVILGPVAVDIGRILVDEDVAEELDACVRIADGRIARDHRTVVLCGEVAHQEYRRIPGSHGAHQVRLEVDEFLLALLPVGSGHAAAGGQEADRSREADGYGQKPTHPDVISPSVCSRTPRCGIRGR